jgi:hypothetical protein
MERSRTEGQISRVNLSQGSKAVDGNVDAGSVNHSYVGS